MTSGRRAGLEGGAELIELLPLRILDKLHFNAVRAFECGDEVAERLVLLRVVPLLPPDGEISALRRERSDQESGSEESRCESGHGYSSLGIGGAKASCRAQPWQPPGNA
jgi:hypothetical protein